MSICKLADEHADLHLNLDGHAAQEGAPKARQAIPNLGIDPGQGVRYLWSQRTRADAECVLSLSARHEAGQQCNAGQSLSPSIGLVPEIQLVLGRMHHATLLDIYHLIKLCPLIHRPFQNNPAVLSPVSSVQQHSPDVAQQAQHLHATFLPPCACS